MSDSRIVASPDRIKVDTALVAGLCVAAFAQAWMSLGTKSLTYDELTYIPAGYTYVVTGDYRLNPEHPPLAKLMAGTALLAAAPRLDLSHESWDVADQWSFARHFFETAGAETADLVTLARLPTVLLLMGLVGLAYLMGRELYGRRAGLLAAWLCAFSPNLLAHGRLATNDFAQSAFVLATAYAFLRFVRAPSALRALGAGVVLGLALLTKYSAILLLGLVAVWVGVAASGRRVAFFAASLGLALLAAALVVSLGYGSPRGGFDFVRNLGVLYSNVHLDLPTYFAGTFHEGGLWYYFVAAFLLKTPVAFLALLALKVVDQARRRDVEADPALYLLLPTAVWLVVMTATALQFGLRYILPVYPLLFVYAAGVLGSRHFRAGRGLVAVGVLAALFAVASLRAFPHYLPYFNILAGGPDRGIEWLDDSNVDWGQDLPLLREWLEAREIDDAVLVPMAAYDPALYGVPGRTVAPAVALPQLGSPDLAPGVYAVSAHLLTRFRWGAGAEVDPLRDRVPAAVLGHSIYVFEEPAR